MALHRVTIYIRQRGGAREKQPAYPKVNYASGTIFLLRYCEQGKRVWKTLPVATYNEAVVEAKTLELELFRRDTTNYTASSRGIKRIQEKPEFVEPETPAVLLEPPVAKDTLGHAIGQYLANIAKIRAKGTAQVYEVTLKQFYQSCGGKPIRAITQQDLVNFVDYLKAKGQGDITIRNKVVNVICLLKANKINGVTLKVKYVDKPVRAFRADELERLFAVATDEEALLFKFFLSTGGREQEIMNAKWSQIDFVDRVFLIRETENLTLKNHQRREVPLPDFLIDALKEHKKHATSDLIFGKPGTKQRFARPMLHRLARRAGLQDDFGLHRFRKSYATSLHRNGTDVKTIKDRLGHSSILITDRYLQGEDARSELSRSQANQTFGAYA